jgi:hypothetical protein
MKKQFSSFESFETSGLAFPLPICHQKKMHSIGGELCPNKSYIFRCETCKKETTVYYKGTGYICQDCRKVEAFTSMHLTIFDKNRNESNYYVELCEECSKKVNIEYIIALYYKKWI